MPQAVEDLRAWAGDIPARRRHLVDAIDGAVQKGGASFAREQLSCLKEEMAK